MPEEVNRVLTDRMSSVLVCPTDAAVAHLEAEELQHSRAFVFCFAHPTTPNVLRTGDVMHDNALHFSGMAICARWRSRVVDLASSLKMWTRFPSVEVLDPRHFRVVGKGMSGRRCFPSIQELGARWRMKCLDGDDS